MPHPTPNHIYFVSPAGRSAIQHTYEIEHHTMRLVAMIGPDTHTMHMVMEEVERRTALFMQRQATSTRVTNPHPRIAALQSVHDDIASGRLV